MSAGRLADRLAGAPISWGVCEVPGWGWQQDPATVLRQMAELGLRAAEFGPPGFLPGEPLQRAAVLAEHGLQAVGGFLPVVLHDPAVDPAPAVLRELAAFSVAGAQTLVLAAVSGRPGYDGRTELDPAGWATLLAQLDRLASIAAERGVTATLHPHVGTLVETDQDVGRVLAGSTIGLTLDTGHLLIGGADPLALAVDHADRVAHVHLKDVDAAWVSRVRSGAVGYTAAVRAGIYRPLGTGHARIGEVVRTLEAAAYQGWYVLEQDAILTGDPRAGGGPDPVQDVRRSVDFLRSLAS